jgi:hypothetical protein
MSFQQYSNRIHNHNRRGSEAKGMHFYLTIQQRQLQDKELVSTPHSLSSSSSSSSFFPFPS